MEFLVVAGMVLLALVAVVTLALANVQSPIVDMVVTTALDIVKIGFGAVVALAYAARGQTPPTTSTTATRTTTTTKPAAAPEDKAPRDD